MDLNFDDMQMPDLAGCGIITDLIFSKEQAVRLKISDNSVPGKESAFELDANHSLTEALVEMKTLEMPLAVVRVPAGSATRYCFLGALPRRVVQLEELTHPLRLEGEILGAFGCEFVVNGTNPNYCRIKERMERSLSEKLEFWTIVAAGPASQRQLIVDVLEPFDKPHCVLGEPFHDEFDEAGFYPVTPEKATEIFESFDSTSPTSGPLTGIPFKYVFDGCEDRCHQMVKQILARNENIQPFKIWAFPQDSYLKFRTEYSPLNCQVLWAFHCAPALMTTRGVQVIDPSTGSCPVSVPTWHRNFQTGGSKLYYTSHHVYQTRIDYCKVFMSDPQYSISDLMIRVYRIHLRLQTCLYGAPPYICI